MNNVIIVPRMSAFVKCSYREDTAPLDYIQDHMGSLEWSKLIVAINWALWSVYIFLTYTILQIHYDEYNGPSEHNNYGQFKSMYDINDFHLQ